MEQTTFAGFLVAQSEAAFARVQKALWDACDEQGGPFDYEEEDHYGRQLDYEREDILASWS